jgi:hypothetical protein
MGDLAMHIRDGQNAYFPPEWVLICLTIRNHASPHLSPFEDSVLYVVVVLSKAGLLGKE